MHGARCPGARFFRAKQLAKEELGVPGIEALNRTRSLVAKFCEKFLHGHVGTIRGSEDHSGVAFDLKGGQEG